MRKRRCGTRTRKPVFHGKTAWPIRLIRRFGKIGEELRNGEYNAGGYHAIKGCECKRISVYAMGIVESMVTR